MAGQAGYTKQGITGASAKQAPGQLSALDDMRRNLSSNGMGGPSEVVVYRSSTLDDYGDSPHTPKGKHSGPRGSAGVLTPRRALALALMLTALALATLVTIPLELVREQMTAPAPRGAASAARGRPPARAWGSAPRRRRRPRARSTAARVLRRLFCSPGSQSVRLPV